MRPHRFRIDSEPGTSPSACATPAACGYFQLRANTFYGFVA
ncbi:hypothetical protein BSLA_02f1566 [Burkholderia stabilis]|nr:hypothetical protein BSLA_02f1566 [Burkholderia stabilis]